LWYLQLRIRKRASGGLAAVREKSDKSRIFQENPANGADFSA
jgi:hypothetical protein